MKNNNILSSKFIILAVGVLFFMWLITQWQNLSWNTAIKNSASCINNAVQANEKQRGAHIFGDVDTSTAFLPKNNIEWVTLVAWVFQENCSDSIVRHHNGDSIYIQKSDSGWVSRMKLARSAGFKVFLKPHVWVSTPADGKWRSDIFPTNDKNWETWKVSYRDFIIRYALLAEQANVEMFCIGTEFTRLTLEKKAYWKSLIRDVRRIYSGKITYAANWYKEYHKIKFWEELDYIGVQAYFPLAKKENPSVRQISRGWNKYLSSLKSISKKHNRKILFTELGYKSTSDSAISPWDWLEHSPNQSKTYSLETQSNCYEAFFQKVWSQEWFAGVHLWSMRSDDKKYVKKKPNLDFTPLGKPAEQVIAKGFQ